MNDKLPRVEKIFGRPWIVVKSVEGATARAAIDRLQFVNGDATGRCAIIGDRGAIAAAHSDEEVWSTILSAARQDDDGGDRQRLDESR